MKIIILSGIAIILMAVTIILSSNICGYIVMRTPQQIYKQTDVIIVGKIGNAVGRLSERSTDYTVSVEKYLKNDLHQGTLLVNGIGKKNSAIMAEDEPIFSVGERVVLYLTKVRNEYQVSPYSHILSK